MYLCSTTSIGIFLFLGHGSRLIHVQRLLISPRKNPGCKLNPIERTQLLATSIQRTQKFWSPLSSQSHGQMNCVVQLLRCLLLTTLTWARTIVRVAGVVELNEFHWSPYNTWISLYCQSVHAGIAELYETKSQTELNRNESFLISCGAETSSSWHTNTKEECALHRELCGARGIVGYLFVHPVCSGPDEWRDVLWIEEG